MGRGGATYEREIRDLLAGNAEALRAYAGCLPPERRLPIERLRESPFVVLRAAGSFGCDLVAVRRHLAFLIEVKASAEDAIRFSAASGRAQEQWRAHQREAERAGAAVLYAYRRIGLRSPGDRWRLFRATNPPDSGLLGYFLRHLPPIELTAGAHGVLRWASGADLSRFLAVAQSLLGESEADP